MLEISVGIYVRITEDNCHEHEHFCGHLEMGSASCKKTGALDRLLV